jgi:hypothetical protein
MIRLKGGCVLRNCEGKGKFGSQKKMLATLRAGAFLSWVKPHVCRQ